MKSTKSSFAFLTIALIFSLFACESTAYVYYGGYARPAVVVARPVVVVRRGRWGRKLLLETKTMYTPSKDCKSMLEIINARPALSKLASIIEKLPKISKALQGGDDVRTIDTFFAPTNEAIDGFLAWTAATNKTEEFSAILGNRTVAGAIVAYHVLPEALYNFGALVALDRKFVGTALSNAVSDTQGLFSLQVDEDKGNLYIKGVGSEVKIIAADNYACNGIIHFVDGVLLPFDADGELSDKQRERLEDAKAMMAPPPADAFEDLLTGAAPAPSPSSLTLGEEIELEFLPDLAEGESPAAEAPSPSPEEEERFEVIEDEVVLPVVADDTAAETEPEGLELGDAPAEAPAPLRTKTETEQELEVEEIAGEAPSPSVFDEEREELRDTNLTLVNETAR